MRLQELAIVGAGLLMMSGCQVADNPARQSRAANAPPQQHADGKSLPTMKTAKGIEDKSVAMSVELVAIAAQHRGNCGELAAAWDGYMTEHRALLDEVADFYRPMTREQGIQFEEKYGAPFAETRQAYHESWDACRGDPAMVALIHKFGF